MKQVTTLTKQQEDLLIKTIRKGEVLGAKKPDVDKALIARKKLISDLQPLIVSVAIKYLTSGTPQEELIKLGNLGIRKALLKYDPLKNYKFSTYTTWYIRAEIHKKLGIPT